MEGSLVVVFFFLPVVSVELETELVLLDERAFPFGSAAAAMLGAQVVMVVKERLEMPDEIIQHDACVKRKTCKVSFNWIARRDNFLESNSERHGGTRFRASGMFDNNNKKKGGNFQVFLRRRRLFCGLRENESQH